MLKMIEKLVDRHIRDEILGLRPIHQYQPGKSTETALHHVITHIEEAVENREVLPEDGTRYAETYVGTRNN
jgi:hypothetical protein